MLCHGGVIGASGASAGSAIAYKQQKYATGYGPETVALSLDSSVIAGSTLVVAIASGGDMGTDTCSDNNGNSYAQLGKRIGANSGSIDLFYTLNANIGPTAISVYGATPLYVAAYEFSGIASIDVFDYAADLLDNSAPFQPFKAITTTQPNGLLFVMCNARGNNQPAFTGGYGDITNYTAHIDGFGTGYAIASSSGAKSCGLTANGADYFGVYAVSFGGS